MVKCKDCRGLDCFGRCWFKKFMLVAELNKEIECNKFKEKNVCVNH